MSDCGPEVEVGLITSDDSPMVGIMFSYVETGEELETVYFSAKDARTFAETLFKASWDVKPVSEGQT